MEERSFDGMIAYFNRRVSEMDIAQDYKMELFGMVTALGYKHEKTAQPKRKKGKWIQTNAKDCERRTSLAYLYKCNRCGYEDWFDSNFCPECGADMREE